MNIKKIFNESASDLLTKKKADYLSDLQKEAQKVIDSKKENRDALVAAQEEVALKIARIGQAKTFDEFQKAITSEDKGGLVYSLLTVEAKVKRLNSEIADLEAAMTEMFG